MDDVSSSCKGLCNEMATNILFLVDIFNAVSGKNGLVEIATRVKYGFVYSVLMNERWHELSLVKRVNTVLVIEGGCTKQV
jgi:hypothetical protein